MAKTPEQLEAEANAEFEALMKGPEKQDNPEPEIKEPANPEPSASNQEDVANPTTKAPEAKPAEDKAPGNLEESYKNLRAHTTKVSQENGELRRQLETMQQQLNQLQQSSNTGSNKPDDLPEPDELDSAASDFDELSPLVRKIKEQAATIKKLEDRFASEDQKRETDSQQEYYKRIAAVHADHQQIYQSPEFQGWMQRLTGIDSHAAQYAFSQGTAEDVIAVFTRYKQASGLGSKQEQAAQLADPSVKSRSIPQTSRRPKMTQAEFDALDPKEYAKNEAMYDEMWRNGEIM